MKGKKEMKSKVLSLFCLLILTIFSSCSSNNIVDPGNETPVNNLSGSISNWPGQSLIVRAMIIYNTNSADVGTDTVLANGQFNINLTTPPPSVLAPIKEFIGDTALTISDTGAFFANFSSLWVYDITNTVTGFVQRRNFDSTIVPGSFLVTYIYSDRNTSITGTVESAGFADTIRSTINLNLVTGWNKFYLRLVSQTSTLTVYEMNNGEPAGAYWYYYPGALADNRLRLPFGIRQE
jgi:hypothetical protein